MSEHRVSPEIDAHQLAAQELQNRFISDNLQRIFRLIYRIVGNVADAQDLTQEAFIKALQRQDQLKDLEKATHWLSRIASNTAIDFLRRTGKVNFCEIDSLVEPLSEPTESPEQAVLRSEHRAYLEEGLAVLTDRERTALLLRDVEGLGADEVAEHMNCSKATVRSRSVQPPNPLRDKRDARTEAQPARGSPSARSTVPPGYRSRKSYLPGAENRWPCCWRSATASARPFSRSFN